VRRVNELDPEVCRPALHPKSREVSPRGYKPSCTTLSQPSRRGHAEENDLTDLI
jgi:hypothetical protein